MLLCKGKLGLATSAIALAERVQFGMSIKPLSFHQEEVVRAARSELEYAKLRYQGQYIAAEISKILANAFGGR